MTNKTQVLTIRLEPDLYDRLKAHAEANPGSVGAHVRAALELYLEGDSLEGRVAKLEQTVEYLMEI